MSTGYFDGHILELKCWVSNLSKSPGVLRLFEKIVLTSFDFVGSNKSALAKVISDIEYVNESDNGSMQVDNLLDLQGKNICIVCIILKKNTS